MKTIDDIFRHAVTSCMYQPAIGSRDGGCSEVLFANYKLDNPEQCVLSIPSRKWSPPYAAAEMLWYLSGDRTIERLLPYAPSYERFADENGEAYGAYGHRWGNNPGVLLEGGIRHPIKQIMLAVDTLTAKPESRQVVVSMWDSGDLAHALKGDKKDLPCTLNMQFILRDGVLSAGVNMRSNDVFRGLPYDIFCFCTLQQLIALEIDARLGTYTHNAGSLHVYSRDLPKVTGSLESCAVESTPYAPAPGVLFIEIERALQFQEKLDKTDAAFEHMPNHMLLRDLCLCCALKFGHDTVGMIFNENLRQSAQQWKERHDNRRRA